ncbi:MAG: cation transporter [Deltaproteobacteria bacterium]|nr:cation transporter [Deltaproteobacteria bacterium]
MPIPSSENLYSRANFLAILTIFFNLAEGLVSVWLGVSDDTLTLFAFGVDSFVEVISALGVWHMIRRLRRASDKDDDRFEKQALRITGVAFCLLAAGLIMTAIWNIYHHHKPETTLWGIVVGSVSIVCMGILVHYKGRTGRQLGSGAIMADAACSRVCMYLGIVLMLASIGYELTGVGLLDSVGSIIIALFSIKEGREALQKAKGLSCCCGLKCSQTGVGQTIPLAGLNKE